jgi:peroxiredoxin
MKAYASIHKTDLVSTTNRGRYCVPMDYTALLIFAAILVIATFAYKRFRKNGRPVPSILRRGKPLPDFKAVNESGDPVRSTELHGTAAVILFVRGNWCPFCSSQVANLTVHYKDIIDLGARLILVTPNPLETTRRVAEFFEVEFEFWLDEDLAVTKELGLLQEAGVPKGSRKEYGEDTIWPTALIVDRNGIIRFTELSKFIADRPNPKTLLRELQAAIA